MRKSQTTATGTTLFTYDEMLVLLETTTAGVLQARNTDYPGEFGGLASQNRGGASSFYGYDSQGSTRILLSTGGVITDSYSYKVFGEPLQTGSGTVNPHTYVGLERYRQQTNGFYLLGVRVLNPFTGQFTSMDPIEFAGGWNKYGYANNNPAVVFDATGLYCSSGPGPKPCCCHVDGFSQTYGPLTTPGAWGNNVYTAVGMENIFVSVGEQPGNCQMQWYEKVSNPQSPPAQKKDTWQNVCDIPTLDCPTTKFNADRPEGCPSGTQVWLDTDPPAVGMGNRNYKRLLCIFVVVTDGCTGRQMFKAFNQYIEISAGKLVALIPGPGTDPKKAAELAAYCQTFTGN